MYILFYNFYVIRLELKGIVEKTEEIYNSKKN